MKRSSSGWGVVAFFIVVVQLLETCCPRCGIVAVGGQFWGAHGGTYTPYCHVVVDVGSGMFSCFCLRLSNRQCVASNRNGASRLVNICNMSDNECFVCLIVILLQVPQEDSYY